jgi:hypothetical protein
MIPIIYPAFACRQCIHSIESIKLVDGLKKILDTSLPKDILHVRALISQHLNPVVYRYNTNIPNPPQAFPKCGHKRPDHAISLKCRIAHGHEAERRSGCFISWAYIKFEQKLENSTISNAIKAEGDSRLITLCKQCWPPTFPGVSKFCCYLIISVQSWSN